MNEYEYLIADTTPPKSNVYLYDGRTLTPQQIYVCVLIQETLDHLGIQDVEAVIAIILGRPLLPTRGKFRFATKGTSLASAVCRYLFDVELPYRLPTLTGSTLATLRLSSTRHLGAFIGRKVPYAGWAILAHDVIAINIKAIAHYNRLVKPEDQINDATVGSLG
ncbi:MULTISPECIES: STM2901 family protein [unclassified Caballeronia]|uniref:STM2901 family protein n=1 Tax=unclassified Caballeronia TaxID=2646786 RepID=UPI0028557F95|nr:MULTISPECIES: hypothetical protein [unclassified Caballeronia]MDR5740662.1 hypothetical protein [Caballeronia sp. LZ016]MDR5808814.1 hypothetical protein [Caballeronia sp. LZ019]